MVKRYFILFSYAICMHTINRNQFIDVDCGGWHIVNRLNVFRFTIHSPCWVWPFSNAQTDGYIHILNARKKKQFSIDGDIFTVFKASINSTSWWKIHWRQNIDFDFENVGAISDYHRVPFKCSCNNFRKKKKKTISFIRWFVHILTIVWNGFLNSYAGSERDTLTQVVKGAFQCPNTNRTLEKQKDWRGIGSLCWMDSQMKKEKKKKPTTKTEISDFIVALLFWRGSSTLPCLP